MMVVKTCALCGKRITEQFWICANCEERHDLVGIPYRSWPSWVKEMAKLDRRQRTIDRREIAFSEYTKIHGFDPFDYITKKR